MKKERVPNIEFEDAQIIFKNFSGEASAYTREGDRKFDLVIDPEIVDNLIADGWNVKKWQNENMEDPLYHLPVKVRFDNFPPKVYKLNSKNKLVPLDENTVGELDKVRIISAEGIVTPYFWDINGKTGITAYLDTLIVKTESNRFLDKYENMQTDPIDDEIDVPF